MRTCTTCGTRSASSQPVSITANVHECTCEPCRKDWQASPNRALYEQHVKAGRGAQALSEFRNWQATRQRRAA